MKAMTMEEMRTVDGGATYVCLGCWNKKYGYVVIPWYARSYHKMMHALKGTYCEIVKR